MAIIVSLGFVTYQLSNQNQTLNSDTEAALNTGSNIFTKKYLTNDTAEVRLIGNTLLTCPAGDTSCAAVQSRTDTTKRNNDFDMKFIDIDNDSQTFNSASAKLNLASGDEIIWAGLFWGGAYSSETTVSSSVRDLNSRNKVKLKLPNTSNYIDVTGQMLGETEGITTSGAAKDYMAYADITSYINSKQSGDFTIANVQLGEGINYYGGWSINFVVKNSTYPIRNIVVYGGHIRVATDTPVQISLNGFLTPKTGDVKSRIGVVALDGDAGFTGDSVKFNNVQISDSLNPANDFFNSTNTEFGKYITARNPSYRNLLGFDIDQLEVTNVLKNNQNSANLELVTDGGNNENYNPFAITIASELYSPDINITQAVSDVNGGATEPNDVLQYTINVDNSGQDGATQNVIKESIPENTTYVPNSIKVDGTNKTDSTDTDTVSFNQDTNQITVNVGTGASPTQGGTLAKNQTSTITYQVKVNSNTPNNTTINAQAGIAYKTATLGLDISGQSNLVTNIVTTSNVTPSPTLTASPSPTTTTVVNQTPTTSPTITVTSTPVSTTTPVATISTITTTISNTTTITPTPDPSLPNTGLLDSDFWIYFGLVLSIISICIIAYKRRKSLEEKVIN